MRIKLSKAFNPQCSVLVIPSHWIRAETLRPDKWQRENLNDALRANTIHNTKTKVMLYFAKCKVCKSFHLFSLPKYRPFIRNHIKLKSMSFSSGKNDSRAPLYFLLIPRWIYHEISLQVILTCIPVGWPFWRLNLCHPWTCTSPPAGRC